MLSVGPWVPVVGLLAKWAKLMGGILDDKIYEWI